MLHRLLPAQRVEQTRRKLTFVTSRFRQCGVDQGDPSLEFASCFRVTTFDSRGEQLPKR
jgi:hypothetical protein